jgi:hypothetical protein
LRQHGVATTLVVDGSRPGVPGFAEGWDRVQTCTAEGDGTALERTLETAVEALDKLKRREHWLLWVELATLLPPWDLPDDFRDKYFEEEEDGAELEDADGESEATAAALEPILDPASGLLSPPGDETWQRLMRTYAGAVAYLDAGLELLFEELRERRLLDKVLLIVTSDHGIPLGEHGMVGECRPWLYRERCHLPLVIRLPGSAEAGRAVERIRDYACAGLQLGECVEWALWTPEWSLLLPLRTTKGDPPRGAQLFVQPDDRWEINDLRQHHMELAEGLEQTLRGFVAAASTPGPLAPPALWVLPQIPG